MMPVFRVLVYDSETRAMNAEGWIGWEGLRG